jgi:hypothetical protein
VSTYLKHAVGIAITVLVIAMLASVAYDRFGATKNGGESSASDGVSPADVFSQILAGPLTSWWSFFAWVGAAIIVLFLLAGILRLGGKPMTYLITTAVVLGLLAGAGYGLYWWFSRPDLTSPIAFSRNEIEKQNILVGNEVRRFFVPWGGWCLKLDGDLRVVASNTHYMDVVSRTGDIVPVTVLKVPGQSKLCREGTA